MKSGFLHPGGYTLRPVNGHPGRFEFRLRYGMGLTFRNAEGLYIQPDRHHFRGTDGCSTPFLMRWIPGFETMRFVLSGIFHDSAYMTGGRFVSLDGADFHFEPCSFLQANYDLREMIPTESRLAPWAHCDWVREQWADGLATTYWAGVTAGGWPTWLRYRRSSS